MKESPYGLQINEKTGVQTIPLDFLQKWNSLLKNKERQLFELWPREAKVVCKAVEGMFKKKLRKMFLENFRAARNKLKRQSERSVVALGNKL